MPALAALALLFLATIYGAASVYMNWWPGSLVSDARNAAEALFAVQNEELVKNWPTSMEFIETTAGQSLATIDHNNSGTVADDLIFVDGGSQQLLEHCPSNGCLAWIMDRQGGIRHVWDIGPKSIWEDVDHVEGFSRADNIYSVGAHPFPNGDLLIVYQGRNTYPYGVGIAKFDKDSNLLWRKDNFAHHWFSVDADGLIYIAAFNPLPAPVQLGDTHMQIDCNGGTLYEDVIAVLDPDGNEIERISILEALTESDLNGLAFQAIHSDRPLPLTYNECDPTHLNDVQVISAADAATSPHLATGDLLISLRSINAVAVLSRASGKITWSSSGRSVLQHSPRYLGDDSILIFDNLGGSAAAGGSRLINLDMSTGIARAHLPDMSDPAAKNFFSSTAGYIDVHEDRQRALVSLTRQGRTLEVELQSGKVLWEFINIHDVSNVVETDNDGGQVIGRFAAQTVRYFNDAAFEFNEGRL